jgi:hypothetical protein
VAIVRCAGYIQFPVDGAFETLKDIIEHDLGSDGAGFFLRSEDMVNGFEKIGWQDKYA